MKFVLLLSNLCCGRPISISPKCRKNFGALHAHGMSRLVAKLSLQAGAGDGLLADLRVHGAPLLALLQEGILDQRRHIEAGEV